MTVHDMVAVCCGINDLSWLLGYQDAKISRQAKTLEQLNDFLYQLPDSEKCLLMTMTDGKSFDDLVDKTGTHAHWTWYLRGYRDANR